MSGSEITTIPDAVRDGFSSTIARTAEPVPWSAEDELRPDRMHPLSAASPSSGNTISSRREFSRTSDV
jgi:hypothetical protein